MDCASHPLGPSSKNMIAESCSRSHGRLLQHAASVILPHTDSECNLIIESCCDPLPGLYVHSFYGKNWPVYNSVSDLQRMGGRKGSIMCVWCPEFVPGNLQTLKDSYSTKTQSLTHILIRHLLITPHWSKIINLSSVQQALVCMEACDRAVRTTNLGYCNGTAARNIATVSLLEGKVWGH